jgi:hypothetical protein
MQNPYAIHSFRAAQPKISPTRLRKDPVFFLEKKSHGGGRDSPRRVPETFAMVDGRRVAAVNGQGGARAGRGAWLDGGGDSQNCDYETFCFIRSRSTRALMDEQSAVINAALVRALRE